MKEMSQDRLAFDLASSRTIDPHSGHMHVAQTNISKATVNPYNGSEIPGADELGLDPNKVYNLLRHPEELAAAAKSFNGKPLVMVHKAQAVDDKDHENRVGSVHNVTYEHPYLKGDLAVLDKVAIDAIESGAQRELSCGYAYKPDMTPGTYEGQRYDGIMRQLGGNHVALVREGRAGADCHVFDSLENLRMNTKKVVLSRTGAFAQGALSAHLKPKMAKDAKPIDWTPMWKGVTKANFKTEKARLAADIKRNLAGKLAKDADMSDVVELLDILEPMIEEAGPDVNFQTLNPVADPDPAVDEDPMTAVRAKLKAKGMSEEEIDEICGASNAMDDDDDSLQVLATPYSANAPNAGQDPDGKDKSFGKDKLGKDTKNMVSKTAMDAALAANARAVEKRTIDRLNGIHEAKERVFEWVGKLPQAYDSADGVYRAALTTLGFEGADKLHSDALRPILEAQPKPGDRRQAAPSIAQDAAAYKSFDDRFGTARIGHA